MDDISDSGARTIETYLKAMQTVIVQKVKGAGPEVAKQIVEGLNKIVEKSQD